MERRVPIGRGFFMQIARLERRPELDALCGHLLKVVAIEPFLTLGKASLRVFCTHIFFVFVGLSLLVRDVGEDVGAPLEQLHGITAMLLLMVTFTVLILVAAHRVRQNRARRSGRSAQAGAVPAGPSAGASHLHGHTSGSHSRMHPMSFCRAEEPPPGGAEKNVR